MVQVKVNPGVCGFLTEIEADSKDNQRASLHILTQCPNLKPLEKELTEVDSYTECFAKVGESPVFLVTKRYCRHAACPVPTAIIKGVEVACGLALPMDVEFKIVKE